MNVHEILGRCSVGLWMRNIRLDLGTDLDPSVFPNGVGLFRRFELSECFLVLSPAS